MYGHFGIVPRGDHPNGGNKMRLDIYNCEIKPKARPRFGYGGTIYSPTKKSEDALAWRLCDAVIHEYGQKISYDHPVQVKIAIYSRQPLRGDSDNYAKTVLDALEKAGILENDKLVKELQIKLWSGLSPRLIVEIVPIEPAKVN
jgi:Holliday junction resolvase RusA-like endonuclease